MSIDKNRILVECECGLIFRLDSDDDMIDADRLCGLIPEKDLAARKKKCLEQED